MSNPTPEEQDANPARRLHPAVQDVLRFFTYEHLPAGPLRDTSERCSELAHAMAYDPNLSGAQLTLGLHNLLAAKDCFVRAAL